MLQGQETLSYLMLFCAMLLAKNQAVSFGTALQLVPVSGGARQLANALASASGS